MRVLLGRSAALALCLCALPLAAQEDGSTDSVDLQEQLALDTNALAVLPIEILTSDPRAPALAAEAYEAILSGLASIDGLYVIGRESVLPYAGSALPAVEIARGLGVGTILESSIRADSGGVFMDVDLIDARTGESRGSGYLLELNPNIRIAPPVPFDLDALMPEMGFRIAEKVESRLFPKPPPDPQQAIAEAQVMVLDTSLSDSERLDALKRVRFRGVEAHGGAVVVAAVQIAMTSDESRVRAGVWREMAGVEDSYLVQPLLHSLAYDADEDVRRVAAETLLRGFLDEPDVRSALEYAAENDASERVRSEIRLSMLSETERQEELLATVLDATKTDRERLSAVYGLRYDRHAGFIAGPKALSGEAIIAMVDLARTSESSRIRSEVWSLLSEADDLYLVQPLLDALANDSDELVRDAAARGLVEFLDEAGVSEALEEALVNDASPLVRKRAGESLQSVER